MKSEQPEYEKATIRELMQLLEKEDAYFRSQEVDLDEALLRHAKAEQISKALNAKLSAVKVDIEKLEIVQEA